MKNLALNQMEELRGGFSWKGCAGSAVTLAFAYGSNLAAVVIGGFWGLGAAAVVGCVSGGLALE